MKRLFWLLTVLGVWLLLVSWETTTAASGLPPRPTPLPTAVPAGATIVLRVPNAPANAWTVVQWLDGEGNWHDVEGWRSGLDDIGGNGIQKTWWVSPDDFGTGPFRWQLYEQADGALLSNSDSFYLPAYDKAVSIVEMVLP